MEDDSTVPLLGILEDDTLVVFSGDHGLALGEHSMRVPLVLAGPGVPAGVRDDALVYQASIHPTLCALTGVPVPEGIDLPALLGADPLPDTAFGAYRHLQRMVRTRRWALTAYGPARRVQLFDVKADPWQVHCGEWNGGIDESWLAVNVHA